MYFSLSKAKVDAKVGILVPAGRAISLHTAFHRCRRSLRGEEGGKTGPRGRA